MRQLRSKADAWIIETVDDFAGDPGELFISDLLHDHGLQFVMRNAVKKLPNIQAQYPSISSMLAPKTLHVACQAIHGEYCSFAFLTCAVIIYIVACQIIVEAKIAGRPLDDTVAELRRFDCAGLR